MARGCDPAAGRIGLELVLIDEDRDKAFRSERLRVSWLRDADKQIKKVHGIDATEEVLQCFIREAVRQLPAALRKLFEKADLISREDE